MGPQPVLPQEFLYAESKRRWNVHDLEACDAVVMFEFTHTSAYEPGRVNRYLAHIALQLWHGPLCQRRSVPLLGPPRCARALREAEALWPCSAARRPRIVEFEATDEYLRL